MSKNRHIEFISYVDHYQEEDGWKDSDDEDDLGGLLCVSVGWLCGETDSVVRLCANFSDAGGENEQMCGAMVILKSCIVCRKVLNEQ